MCVMELSMRGKFFNGQCVYKALVWLALTLGGHHLCLLSCTVAVFALSMYRVC